MDMLALLLLTLLFVPLAMGSVYFLIRQPFHVVAVLVFLCVLFYLFPAFAWLYGMESSFEYGFATAGADVRVRENLPALALALGITGLILLGGMWPMWVHRYGNRVRRPVRLTGGSRKTDGVISAHGFERSEASRVSFSSLNLLSKGRSAKDAAVFRPLLSRSSSPRFTHEMLALLGLAWIGMIVLIHHRSGLSLAELILPSRKVKADVYGSFYFLYFAIYGPLAIGAALYLRAKRLGVSSALCFLMSILIALGAAQRRNILVVVLFVVALYFFMRSSGAVPATSAAGDRRSARRPRPPVSRVAMACAGAACLVLGPLLWWLRNYFTGMADPLQELVAPWQRKGFMELFFGSAGGGFPTLLLVKEWVDSDGIQWGVSLLATVCVFIPRELWHNKPQGAEALLQQRFGLVTMPSTFLINELYLNAGLFALPLAALLGRTLSGVHTWCVARDTVRSQLVLAAMFANSITLFKNGLGPFTVNVVFLCGLCWLATVSVDRVWSRRSLALGTGLLTGSAENDVLSTIRRKDSSADIGRSDGRERPGLSRCSV